MKREPIPELLSVDDVGKALGLSRNAVYEAARRYRKTGGAEGIPNLKICGKVLVPVDALRQMLSLPVPGETP